MRSCSIMKRVVGEFSLESIQPITVHEVLFNHENVGADSIFVLEQGR